jgi:hypothetical protein
MPYDNTNRGAIWPNDDKKTDKHPDYTGQINIEGQDYWLSGWKRAPDAKAGSPVVSFRVNRKEQRTEAPKDYAEQKAKHDYRDDIPF